MEKNMDSSTPQATLPEADFKKRFFAQILVDILAWATLWPLIFQVLLIFTDWYTLQSSFMNVVVPAGVFLIIFHFLFLGRLLWDLLMNSIAALATKNSDGITLNTVTIDFVPTSMSFGQKTLTILARILVIGLLAFLPLKALIDSTENSLQLKLQNDCLIKKIEAIEGKTGQHITCDRL